MATKVLITGGCGFIGSTFVDTLLRNTDYEVLNIDCLTYAGDANNIYEKNNSRYQLLRLSINEPEMHGVVSEFSPDYVVHFAAESHVDNSIDSPGEFITTNIVGTYNLLQACKNNCEKFIHISTDEVFGSLTEYASPFSEFHAYKPNSPYSASKASSDLLVRSYFKTYGLPAIITNCSNNYGPKQHAEKLIPKIIINALNDDKIPVYGNGKQIRDWLHVNDHCSAILKILEKGRVGESYCIGGDCEKENIEIVKTILDILDKPHSLIEFVKDRPGHDTRYAITFEKLERETGWKPSFDLKTGLEQTINWYKDNYGY